MRKIPLDRTTLGILKYVRWGIDEISEINLWSYAEQS